MYEKTEEITQVRDMTDITFVEPVHVEGEGILYAKWSPKDQNGRDLGPTLGVFAAPENLPRNTVLEKPLIRKAVNAVAKRTIDKKGKHANHIPPLRASFNKVAEHLSRVKNWHGHDGSSLKTEADITGAVREGDFEALEKWTLPTQKLAEAMFLQKNRGALKDTFTRIRGGDRRQPYATSSRLNPTSYNVLAVDFRGGEKRSAIPHETELYARPIRIMPILD